MSDKMDKLKEAAGENALDTELLDLVVGGNKAQTEELWNFYMSHGAASFLKKYEKDHVKGIMAALKTEDKTLLPFTTSIANANAEKGDNIYEFWGIKLKHQSVMKWVKGIYSVGVGHFEQAK